MREAAIVAAVALLGGCVLPAGSSGDAEGGLLTGGAAVRWEAPPRGGAADEWRGWNACLRAQHALRGGDPCRCVVAFPRLGDLSAFDHCYARGTAVASARAIDPDVGTTVGEASAAPGPGHSELDALRDALRRDEGLVGGPAGEHVGYGHRLPLTVAEAEALLGVAARTALEDAAAAVGADAWGALSPARRVVVASMSYQLGPSGLRRFEQMLGALRGGDYAAAAAAMLDSRWAREQTPGRAARLAARMRTGR